jgi:acetylornithine deacetylase/succinyl-diaminopimelate desuccinylase-like protein
MRRMMGCSLFIVYAAIVGCGGGGGDAVSIVPVAGTIKVDEQPAANVTVNYFPDGKTEGNGGTSSTDSTGRYEIMNPQGKKGLIPGEYKVTLSLRLNKDGSPADPNVMPIESQAIETLAPKYTDRSKTELKIRVAADDKRSMDFSIKSKKK